MKTVPVPVPDDLAAQLQIEEARLPQELRWLIAVKLYELGRVSAGVAAEMAGVSRVEFLNRLAEFRVSTISLDAEAVAQEFETARTLGQQGCNES